MEVAKILSQKKVGTVLNIHIRVSPDGAIKKHINKSPYFHWMNKNRDMITKEYIKNSKFSTTLPMQNKVASYAGKLWREMDPDFKAKYIEDYRKGLLCSVVEECCNRISSKGKKVRGPYKKKKVVVDTEE